MDVWLMYSIVRVSGVQQNYSVMHVDLYILVQVPSLIGYGKILGMGLCAVR